MNVLILEINVCFIAIEELYFVHLHNIVLQSGINMKNNSEKYRLGLFYFDPKYSRIFVPKGHFLLGWTLNFGNRFSYFVISVIVVAIVLIGYYSKQ